MTRERGSQHRLHSLDFPVSILRQQLPDPPSTLILLSNSDTVPTGLSPAALQILRLLPTVMNICTTVSFPCLFLLSSRPKFCLNEQSVQISPSQNAKRFSNHEIQFSAEPLGILSSWRMNTRRDWKHTRREDLARRFDHRWAHAGSIYSRESRRQHLVNYPSHTLLYNSDSCNKSFFGFVLTHDRIRHVITIH
jgi:hypothetical protein